MSKRVVENIQIRNLNETITDMINVIVVLIMIEMDTTTMRVSIMVIMITQDTFTTTYSLNTIHDTLIMTESTEEDISVPITNN